MWLQWHCVSKPRDVVVLFYLARTYADASDQSLATCMIPEIILNIEYAHFDTELLVRTHVSAPCREFVTPINGKVFFDPF